MCVPSQLMFSGGGSCPPPCPYARYGTAHTIKGTPFLAGTVLQSFSEWTRHTFQANLLHHSDIRQQQIIRARFLWMTCVIVMLPSIEVIDSPMSVYFSVLRIEHLFILIHSLLGLTNLPWASFFFSDEAVKSHRCCQQLYQ